MTKWAVPDQPFPKTLPKFQRRAKSQTAVDALKAARCKRIYEDHASGKNTRQTKLVKRFGIATL